jgi:hypothetical protein
MPLKQQQGTVQPQLQNEQPQRHLTTTRPQMRKERPQQSQAAVQPQLRTTQLQLQGEQLRQQQEATRLRQPREATRLQLHSKGSGTRNDRWFKSEGCEPRRASGASQDRRC